MLRHTLPIQVSGLAVALLAGALLALPAHAQSYDDDAYPSHAAVDNDVDDGPSDDDESAIGPEAVPDDGDDDDTSNLDGDTIEAAASSDATEADDDDDGEGRCAAEFRSYDPSSGTYLTYDGDRIRCPYL